MPRRAISGALFVLLVFAIRSAAGQSVQVYQTTPDLLERMAQLDTLHFDRKAAPGANLPTITVDDSRKFQTVDGFGASLTDAAAWLFANKLTPAQTDATFRMLFSRKDGIGVDFLRQPVGSSDLAVTFYSFDDLCEQTAKACTTPPGVTDDNLEHFSLKHDEDYILPLLKKALAVNPEILVMLTPWSPPGWMKTSGSMLGSNPETKEPSSLRPEAYPAFASYLVKTIEGYQAAGVPIYALSVQNEPLFSPPTYSGMQMLAEEQAKFFGDALGPALAAAHLKVKVMAYDHNWDRPDYPETVLKDPKAGALAAGTAWHHYAGDPSVMTKVHDEFPGKDEWVTESSGGAWQTGSPLDEEAGELIAAMRNWAKSYVLWALATDQNHGPFVGGCDTCRGLVTIEDSASPSRVKMEPDYYVLGHASKFVVQGAVRIASDEPAGTQLKDVAFRNPNGSMVLYALNLGKDGQSVRIVFHDKSVVTTIPQGSVATFTWRP